jgi:hypothetical protein
MVNGANTSTAPNASIAPDASIASNMISKTSFLDSFQFSHIFLGLFFMSISIINQDLRGLIWITGALFSTIITQIILKIIGKNKNGDIKECKGLLPIDKNPALSSNIITYTLSYLLFPMMKIDKLNMQIVVGLLLLFSLNGYKKITEEREHCKSGAMELIFVGISGFIIGYLWYKLLLNNNLDRLLYFSEFISDNSICSKPRKTEFRCRVYRNGEIITDSTS